MSRVQIGLIIALTVLLLAVAIITWGSIGSGFCILGLFMIPGTVAYKYLWINREDRMIDEMDPMNIIYNRHLDAVGAEDYD